MHWFTLLFWYKNQVFFCLSVKERVQKVVRVFEVVFRFILYAICRILRAKILYEKQCAKGQNFSTKVRSLQISMVSVIVTIITIS